MRTIDQVLRTLPSPRIGRISPPLYTGSQITRYTHSKEDGTFIGLAVESMQRHTTDEGWQIFSGLQHAGYELHGYKLPLDVPVDLTGVPRLLSYYNPRTIVVQDPREWDVQPRDFREPLARFTGIECLRECDDIFVASILKDAHQKPDYHREWLVRMNCHAVIHYYNSHIVRHLAPYVRDLPLIRTWHSVDTEIVPEFDRYERKGCLLSGAVNRSVYPLRWHLVRAWHSGRLPGWTYLKHPGYHRGGSATPAFLDTLSHYKVAICTSSIYGYALRKIIEATACGCRVITDLPSDELIPEIDGNLVRVNSDVSWEVIRDIVQRHMEEYDSILQEEYADKAKAFYDYRRVGQRLADDIETVRLGYNY